MKNRKWVVGGGENRCYASAEAIENNCRWTFNFNCQEEADIQQHTDCRVRWRCVLEGVPNRIIRVWCRIFWNKISIDQCSYYRNEFLRGIRVLDLETWAICSSILVFTWFSYLVNLHLYIILKFHTRLNTWILIKLNHGTMTMLSMHNVFWITSKIIYLYPRHTRPRSHYARGRNAVRSSMSVQRSRSSAVQCAWQFLICQKQACCEPGEKRAWCERK